MTTKEKFNKFLDERIEQSINDSSKTAYIIVQHQFNELFKDNLMLSLDNEIIFSVTNDKEQAIKNTMCAGGNEICIKCSDICFYHGKHIGITSLKKTIPVPSLDNNDLDILLDLTLGRTYPTEYDCNDMLKLSKKLRKLQNGVTTDKEQPNKFDQQMKDLKKISNLIDTFSYNFQKNNKADSIIKHFSNELKDYIFDKYVTEKGSICECVVGGSTHYTILCGECPNY